MNRWKRTSALAAVAAVCTIVVASLASAAPVATTVANGNAAAATLHIYGFGPGDDVANGRAAIATRALGGAEVDNPRGAFDDRAFLTRLASGDVPDIVYLDRSKVGTYAAKNAFLPLANCLRSEDIDRAQYRAAAIREVTFRGQIYALPEFTNQITLIVDNSTAKKAGVKVADIQTTNWTKLRAAARKMAAVDGGKVTRIGFDPKIPEFFPLWVKWFGADLLSKDGRKAQLNSPQAVQALTYTYQLIKDQGGWDRFKAFRDTWDFFGAKNQVAQDQVGAWPMESWYYNVLADSSPNVDITAKYFTNRKGGPLTLFTGSGWAIPRGSKNPDLACKWMKAMTSVNTWVSVAKDRFDLRKRQNRAFTGLYTANARADVKIYEDIYQPSGKRQFDSAVRLLVQSQRYAFAMPPSPASAEVRQAWMDAINRVLAGKQSPRAALNQAQREAQRAIDQAT
jgi:multiple sugar transport system substrate-binding protein